MHWREAQGSEEETEKELVHDVPCCATILLHSSHPLHLRATSHHQVQVIEAGSHSATAVQIDGDWLHKGGRLRGAELPCQGRSVSNRIDLGPDSR